MSSNPIQVLLVETSTDEARRVARQLAESSAVPFNLDCVERNGHALGRLESGGVDVVLLGLAPSDRLETLSLLLERYPSVPVVVLTNTEDETLGLKAMRQGAQDYLVKDKTDARELAHSLRYAIERKRAEEALQKSEAFYHSLVESLPQNIFRKDLDGRFTFGNGRFCNEIGMPLDEIVGKTDFDFFPAELAEKYRADDLGVIESGKPFEVVEKHVTPQGDTLYVQVIKTPVYDSTGKLIGVQGIFWDITEKFRAEEQLKKAYADLAAKEAELLKTMTALKASHEELIQAQLQLIQVEKLESVGRLAAGVAHEVKNPLAILLMGLEYLGEVRPGGDESEQEVMRAMRDAIGRADGIIRGLVDFSADRRLDLGVQNLNELINRSLVLVKHELIGNHVSLDARLAAELPNVKLDPFKIQQVFVNLFMNAIQAMPDGGTLTVRTRAEEVAPHRDHLPRLPDSFRPGEAIVVAIVEDTGTGIPADKLSKVWDPFFTTKGVGRGTGLGLTVTRKIIDLHGGAIGIANREPRGARVTLVFKAERSEPHAT